MRPVHENGIFAVLRSQKWKDWTAGPVFSGLGLVQLWSFSSLETRPSNTSGPGSVAPKVPAQRHRVRGCSEAGGAWWACLRVFSTCGGAVGRYRLVGAEAWSGVMIMGDRLLTLTWRSGMEWEGEIELVNILAVWSAMTSCCDSKYELNPDA